MAKSTDLALLHSCCYNVSSLIHLPKGQRVYRIKALLQQHWAGEFQEPEVGRRAFSDPLVINYLVKDEGPAVQPGQILSGEKSREVWRKKNSTWCSAHGGKGDADGPTQARLQKGDRNTLLPWLQSCACFILSPKLLVIDLCPCALTGRQSLSELVPALEPSCSWVFHCGQLAADD